MSQPPPIKNTSGAASRKQNNHIINSASSLYPSRIGLSAVAAPEAASAKAGDKLLE